MSRCDLQVLQHCAMAFTLQVVPTSKALQNGRQNSRSVHGMPNRNRLGTPSEHFSALSHCHTSIGFRTCWPQRCRCLPWSMVTGGSMTVWHRPRVGQSWFVEFHYGYRSICGYRQNRFLEGWSIWPIQYELRILILAATDPTLKHGIFCSVAWVSANLQKYGETAVRAKRQKKQHHNRNWNMPPEWT